MEPKRLSRKLQMGFPSYFAENQYRFTFDNFRLRSMRKILFQNRPGSPAIGHEFQSLFVAEFPRTRIAPFMKNFIAANEKISVTRQYEGSL